MNNKYSTPFTIAYVLLAVASLCAGTVFLCSAVLKPKTEIVYIRVGIQPLSNKSGPDKVQEVFKGKPLRVFGQSDLGLPVDGYCEDWSNGISWRVIRCFGTQPESQP